MRNTYQVKKHRNLDGDPPWIWILYRNQYAWDIFATEHEAWKEAEHLEAEPNDPTITES